MVTTTLKLRADLQSAEVVDAEGVLYYDVSDPRTGGVLRLFDYEWHIAQRLDGQRGFDELARWTEEQFGFTASRDDLQVYAERLQQLGLVEGLAAASAKPLPAALYASAALRALSLVPGPIQAAAVATSPAQLAPARESVPSKPPLAATPRAADKPVEPADRRPSRDEDALMGQPLMAAQRPVPALAHPQRPQPVAALPAQPVVTPVATPIVAPPVEPEPLSLPQVPLARAKSDVLDAIESLPPPADDALADAATPATGVEQVQPPVLRPETTPGVLAPVAHTPVVLTASAAELLSRIGEQTAPQPVMKPLAAQIPIEQEPVSRTAEPSKPSEAVSAPVEPTPAERPTAPLGDIVPPAVQPPVSVQPTPPATVPSVKTPVPAPQPTGGAGRWFVALIVVAALAFAVYYFLVLRQPPPPPALGVSVSVAKPEDVARSFPTSAVVKKAEPQPLKIDGDGVVAKVVAENTEVQPDTVLVQLDSQTKLNTELVDLRDRLNFYQKKLDSPKNKGKKEQLRDAQQKIAEKQQRLEQVEGLIKKSQLVAPRPGAVSKVMVKVGQAVTAGTEVVSLSDKALAAEIKIPAIEAQGMKVGQDAQLAGTGGAVTARVASLRTEGDYAMVSFLLPENATAKPGDELKLQKAPLSQVVRMPAAALVDGSKVFVLRDGKAASLPVTVADRDGDAVLLQGLPGGEQVIVGHPSELHEGTAVKIATPGAPGTP